MDSELKIRDTKGNVLAENDDAIGKDSRIDWTSPADGDYQIDVRDLAGHAGPTYYYNLTAEPLKPDFRLKFDTDRGMIAPGNRTAWFAIVERRYGFATAVKVDVTGLPPGVSVTPLTLPPNITQGPLIFTAAPDAKIDMSLVQVTGTAMLPGVGGKQMAVSHAAAQSRRSICLEEGVEYTLLEHSGIGSIRSERYRSYHHNAEHHARAGRHR